MFLYITSSLWFEDVQYDDNSGSKTHAVGKLSPNELGLYDMSGNVWEWCSDRYGAYSSNSLTNPDGPSSGPSRVSRGGSWYNGARGCRVSFRITQLPGQPQRLPGLSACFPQVTGVNPVHPLSISSWLKVKEGRLNKKPTSNINAAITELVEV